MTASDGHCPSTGLRVFTTGHSFHAWVAPILENLAHAAGFVDHRIAGVASVGGTIGTQPPPYLMHHWNLPPEVNPTAAALRAGQVDVLTLSPIWHPDAGIEKFASLAFEHNPHVRVMVQAFWLPNDEYEPVYPLATKKQINHNDAQMEPLRSAHQAYFASVEKDVAAVNARFDRQVVFITPVGQAVLELREWIIQSRAPGLAEQWDLFADCWGHPLQPIQLLTAYCHFAMIYHTSPVGLPVPDEAVMPAAWQAKRDWRDARLNHLLQTLAHEAVCSHPLSGLRGRQLAALHDVHDAKGKS